MLNYHKIIDRNFSHNALVTSLLEAKKLPVKMYPAVTVSRDSGSGGRAIARNIAKKLGFSYLNREKLMRRIVKKANLDSGLVKKALQEESISPWESMINSFLGVKTLNDQIFIRTLAYIILEEASKGPIVVLGRGANFILPPETTLRVRITAPRQVLIRYAMQFEGHGRMKARQEIDKYMESRRKFVYKYFSKDVSKAHYYDVCVSTEYLSIEDAGAIVLKAFEKKFTKKERNL